MAQARLFHRGMIRVSGDDARNFLQGIVTNDVFKVMGGQAVYACFLTPQGKYLADFFIYADGDDLLLDIDKTILPDLLKRLTMYKLRSKVALADVSTEFSIGAVWDEDRPTGDHCFADPRLEAAGYRVLNPDFTGDNDYALWQMRNGLPDVGDFARERTTMLEANMDFLHGVAWDKGCYMGQELTARTHYRGLTKKRFLPVELSSPLDITIETPVTQDGKIIGYAQRTVQNYALAVIQLDALQNGHQCQIAGVDARISLPEWFDLAAMTTRP